MNYLHLAVIWPLIGSLTNGLFGKWIPRRVVAFIACLSVFLSFLVSLYVLLSYLGAGVVSPQGWYIYTFLDWLKVSGLSAPYSFIVDPLSLTMAITVSLVSLLIHVYSVGYMQKDPGFPRYFTYLNLFVAMMLLLVTSSNLVLMFIGWEGVGLCSYLLIGFWYEKEAPPKAGLKAFIVNRIGDFAFLLGIFLIFWLYRSVEFSEILKVMGSQPMVKPQLISLTVLLLFVGAIGKSAQFPLYVWLPDAMEGPTPVSALIHAATMVTAGVYMVVRLNFLFNWSDPALLTVAFVGAFTAIFSASMALVSSDIKRVLAYSTISQLGYMFMSAGLGAYWVAIFHLITHAFFKALLFLSAGSVLHALEGELDMRKMGGLAKLMPQTYWNFLIGAMALSGLPLLSGFFSKDLILYSAFVAKPALFPYAGKLLWIVGTITALMTAFYAFRQVFLIFLTPPRFSPKLHPHDPPNVMRVPMWLLSVGAILVGYIGLPALFTYYLRIPNILKPFLEAVAPTPSLSEGGEAIALSAREALREVSLMSVAILSALLGLYLSYYMYRQRYGISARLKTIFRRPYQVLVSKYYVDEFYHRLFVINGEKFARFLDEDVDRGVVDGFVNFLAFFIGAIGQLLRSLQSGFVRSYAFYMCIGAITLILILWRSLT